MLTSLSASQVAMLKVYRDEYIRRGLSTAPADRAAAQDAICDAYKVANLPAPKLFIWLESPLRGAIGAPMLKAWDQVGDRVGDRVRDRVRDQVRDQVGDRVRAQVGVQVGTQVWAQVWVQVRTQVQDQVGVQVGAQVRDQVWAQVRDQVRTQVQDQVWAQVQDQVGVQVGAQVQDQVRDQVQDQIGAAGYGQHDAEWLSFYAFFAEQTEVRDALRLAPLSRLANAAGWWWPFANACIVTDRPSVLNRDESNRLHSSNGPAIQYRDGWSIFAWHGYRIPSDHAWIIEDKARITAKVIMAEPNAELRRVMCEITAFEPIRSIAKTIAKDVDGNGLPRRLMSARIGKDTIRIVEVENGSVEPDGSRRKFILGAMPGETPHDVIAASYGIAPEHYREAVRT